MNCHMPRLNEGMQDVVRTHMIYSPTRADMIEAGHPNACNLCHLDQPMGWSAQKLNEWYSIDKPALSTDQNEIAYAILKLTTGDAGQRALVAWSMGWEPAQQASGAEWMAPYLGLLLNDSYEALRYMGGRSLQSLPGFAKFPYDFLGSPEALSAVPNTVITTWARARQGSKTPRRDLHVDVTTVRRLLSERDDTPVYLNE